MEKSRSIWNPTRSLLGLVLFGSVLCSSLVAKEIFDVVFCPMASNFDYSSVKTASFFFISKEKIDSDGLIQSLAKEKADVVVTGNHSIEGEALSAGITTFIMIDKNTEENCWLVTINSYVNGVATKSQTRDGEKLRGAITISGTSLVFNKKTKPKEIEKAIAAQLQDLVGNIIGSSKTRPKFFVVH